MTPQPAAALVFYDGTCGLCQRSVRFLLARDRDGSRFRFAPLGGETFRRLVPERERAVLPDSLVVRTPDGRLLVRSEAALYALGRARGAWRLVACLGRACPGSWRDRAYDRIARARHRWFRPPAAACPLLPPDLRARFDP